MRDDCLDLSIELSTYFWNQDETGTMRFSAINHCGRVMGSDSETGMGMVLYTGAFTPVVSISESNATGWIQDEWGYTNAYFAPLQPGEEAWIEVTVTAKRPNLSDQPGHTFPSIYWFEEHSLYDGMTYRDFHQTSNYVCNKDDDGQRTRRTESRLEIGTELP